MIELHAYCLGDGVRAFSTTRRGGVSRGAYGQFNINPYCGDDVAAVSENRRLLARELGIGVERIVMSHQVHGTRIMAVTPEILHLSNDRRCDLLEGVDALMTDVGDVCIGVSTADCIPVLLYDDEHRAAAAVHAGWRGTTKHIVTEVIEAMKRNYRTRPEALKAVFGPGISLHNFEVGQEVYDEFLRASFPMDKVAVRFPAMLPQTDCGGERWHIDLKLCNRLELEAAGISCDRIEDTAICTYDSVVDFFSARRLGIRSGRIYTGIIMV